MSILGQLLVVFDLKLVCIESLFLFLGVSVGSTERCVLSARLAEHPFSSEPLTFLLGRHSTPHRREVIISSVNRRACHRVTLYVTPLNSFDFFFTTGIIF